MAISTAAPGKGTHYFIQQHPATSYNNRLRPDNENSIRHSFALLQRVSDKLEGFSSSQSQSHFAACLCVCGKPGASSWTRNCFRHQPAHHPAD